MATVSRAPNDIYVLDEVTKACLLAKEDEIWLWHKRMGHINFDNLVRINKKVAVKKIPKLSKISNTQCEAYRHDKQKKSQFKTK